MKKQYIYSAFILTAVLTAGCAKEFENTTDDRNGAAIELSSVSTDPMTKAVITGTSFTTDEAAAGIGLFLLDGEGNAYGSNPANVKYYHSGSKWVADSPLRIGNTEGTLVGYYPYSETSTNVKAIPVVSSINGTDYLFGSITEINSAKAKTESLTLSHALTRLKITFKLDNSFVGSGTLSSLTIEGDGVAASGTLDATTGTVTATKSAFTVSGLNASISTGLTEDCLVVPASASNTPQAVTLRFTVDGKAYKVDLTDNLAVKLQSGIQTDINLTVKNTSVSIDGTSIGAWGDGGSQTVTVGGDYKVTIAYSSDSGIKDDVWIKNVEVVNNSVVVTAQSVSGQHLKCFMPDGEFCSSQSKTGNLVYTFTISDITENTTATIGYANLAREISVSPENAGHVEIEGLQYANYYFEGEIFKHKAIPNEGYFFGYWRDQYGNILCESEEYTFRPSSKVDVTAVFFNNKVFVSPSYAGSISSFRKGAKITLTTTPCGNSEFIGWKDKDGNILSDDKTYTFTIEYDTIVVAEYSVDCSTDALDGVFTVAADNGYGKPKKVRFSKGNLWYGKTSEEATSATFNFEESQWDFKVLLDGNWDTKHISHFMWSKDASVTYQQTYSDPQASADDAFFTNSENFSVNGVSTWHSLSSSEWAYLLGGSAERSGKYRTGVTVNDVMGLVIAPDKFNGTIRDSYDASEWATAEINDGLVFFPAAGCRGGFSGNTYIINAGSAGYYWSASSDGDINAFGLYFGSGNVNPNYLGNRSRAYSVRLVTECQSEPSAE